MDDSRILDREVNPFEPIVNDGLLGGSLVETDAEILKLPGLSRRDRVQFGSTEDMTVLELADRTGVIGSQPEKVAIINRTPGSLLVRSTMATFCGCGNRSTFVALTSAVPGRWLSIPMIPPRYAISSVVNATTIGNGDG